MANALGESRGNHVHLRHRDADLLRQPLDDLIGPRQLFARYRLGPVHGQRDLVAEEVRSEIHDDGEDQRHRKEGSQDRQKAASSAAGTAIVKPVMT